PATVPQGTKSPGGPSVTGPAWAGGKAARGAETRFVAPEGSKPPKPRATNQSPLYAGVSSPTSTSTWRAKASASAGSRTPAPSACVLAAPHATASRSAASGGSLPYQAARNPARKASPDPTVLTTSSEGSRAHSVCARRPARNL